MYEIVCLMDFLKEPANTNPYGSPNRTFSLMIVSPGRGGSVRLHRSFGARLLAA